MLQARQTAQCGQTARGRPSPGARPPVPARRVAVRAGAGDEEDLMQFPDRLKWYSAKFAADDMPDWNAATLVQRRDLAPGVASLVLSLEISRERVPLRNAYVAAGQRARLRSNSGLERVVPVASPPPGVNANHEALYMTRGDIFSGETKGVREPVSKQAEVEVVVTEKGEPELFNVEIDDALEAGPFDGPGLDLRTTGAMAPFRFPTLVIFASGPAGIAAARALIESPVDAAGLSVPLRKDVVVYYHVPNEAAVCFRDRFEAWAALGPVRVEVNTRGFADAFDGDMQLLYDPDSTAAVILAGGDEEAEAAAREVCAEAEIATIVSDSAPAAAPVYLSATPRSFEKWAQQHQGQGAAEAADDEGAAKPESNGKVSVR